MKEYKLNGNVTISIYTTVEANSLKEAIEVAEDRNIEVYEWGLKYQRNEAWVAEEYDGTPKNITDEE